MKTKILKLGAGILLFVSIQSCNKSSNSDIPEMSKEIQTIAKAKIVYEANKSQFVRSPDWSSAYFHKDSKDSIFKVSLQSATGLKELVFTNLNKNGSQSEIKPYVLQYFPDYITYMSNEKDHKEMKDQSYSGIILKFATDGSFIQGNVYKNGVITRDIQVNNDPSKPSTEDGQSVDCSNPKGPWVQYCATFGNLGGVTITGSKKPGAGNPTTGPGTPVGGGTSFSNNLEKAIVLQFYTFQIDDCIMEWDRYEYEFGQDDPKNPNPKKPKNIAKVNGTFTTKNGSVFTEWTDNSGRVHLHLNLGSFYKGFMKEFYAQAITISNGVATLFEIFKEGTLVSPVSWGSFYGAEAEYIMREMNEYYGHKKEQNKKNGGACQK